MDKDSAQANGLATLLGLVLGPVTGQVGIQCSPVTAIGGGSGAGWCVFFDYCSAVLV